MAYSADELYLIECVRKGERAFFANNEKISAGLIRRLMLGRPDISGEVVPVGCGVRVSGAIITDEVDLCHARNESGGPLPVLTLEYCRMEKGINLSFAQIGSVSIAGSKLNRLVAVDAYIDGALICSDVAPLNEGSPCTVNLRSAYIDGDLALDHAVLSARKNDESAWALNMQSAIVEGDVFLQGSAIKGNSSLYGAQIKYGIQAQGARIVPSAGSRALFVAINAGIGDDVNMMGGFEIHGSINFSGARIASDLNCQGSRFLPEDGDPSLHILGAEIGGNVYLNNGFEATGSVRFSRSKIGGHFIASEASFKPLTITVPDQGVLHDYALELSSASIGGYLTLRDSVAIGAVRLHSARTGGNFECGNFDVRPDETEQWSINATNMQVGGDALLRDMKLSSGICLSGGFVAGDLDGRRTVIDTTHESDIAFLAVGLRVGGDLYFVDAKAFGTFNVYGATIGGSARFSRMQIVPGRHDSDALQATNMSVTGDVFLSAAVITHPVIFTTANINRDLICAGAAITATTDLNGIVVKGSLVLSGTTTFVSDQSQRQDEIWFHIRDASIGNRLRVGNFKGQLALNGTRAGGFDDDGTCGRGQTLDLDGFVYDRLEMFGVDEELDRGNSRKSLATDRLYWISRQKYYRYSPVSLTGWLTGAPNLKVASRAFSPQPLLQLAHVFHRTGYEAEANKVLTAKQWLETRRMAPVPRGIFTLFGMAFGFGYSPFRSILTLALYVFIGYLGVGYALDNKLLVVDTQAVASVSIDGRIIVPSQVPPNPVQVDKINYCDRTVVTPVYYAIDLMVPFLDLHQENKCEIAAEAGDSNNSTPDASILWQGLRTGYAVLGWLVVSLSILTFSGLLRVKDPRT